MGSFWKKASDKQLDLLGVDPVPPVPPRTEQPARNNRDCSGNASVATAQPASITANGHPLLVPLDRVDEDPNNPRTEFPEPEITELADDIRERGILEPIVVQPADAAGRYRVHFGAKRLRAARQAGLDKVLVVFRDAPADTYAQVAENQKRHGLTPLDLARLIRAKVNEGESNATIAKRLVMDPTTVAHHLALLDLPPELDRVLKSGRCTSPKTLYELSKLHDEQPERVKVLLAGDTEITRAVVAAVRAENAPVAVEVRPRRGAPSLVAQANSQCARLEQTLTRLKQVEQDLHATDLAALRQRVANLASRSA
jgi:ParB family transcriptional regulator, chromosome partitioning protein